ncbi:helix-turn-helix domain-containing protein [Amycolatopsis sp. NPDC102389]|uniref:helix-turn-helix domain-containing protein n=1 Tax=Amycolatopsis sp. NPDC102389 TaxID=3363941 RepID=UPI00382B4282
MPRPERPLESDGGVVCEFAAALRRLRQEAGTPPYRWLATHAHYSASTLAAAAAGKQLPTLPVTRAFAAACGADPDTWEQHWHDARARADVTAAPPEPPAPTGDDGIGTAQFPPTVPARTIRHAVILAVAACLAVLAVINTAAFGQRVPATTEPDPMSAQRTATHVRGDLRVSSADGRRAAVTEGDGVIRLWDTQDIAAPRRAAAVTTEFPPSALRLADDGATLIATLPYRPLSKPAEHERRWNITDLDHPREISAGSPTVTI